MRLHLFHASTAIAEWWLLDDPNPDGLTLADE